MTQNPGKSIYFPYYTHLGGIAVVKRKTFHLLISLSVSLSLLSACQPGSPTGSQPKHQPVVLTESARPVAENSLKEARFKAAIERFLQQRRPRRVEQESFATLDHAPYYQDVPKTTVLTPTLAQSGSSTYYNLPHPHPSNWPGLVAYTTPVYRRLDQDKIILSSTQDGTGSLKFSINLTEWPYELDENGNVILVGSTAKPYPITTENQVGCRWFTPTGMLAGEKIFVSEPVTYMTQSIYQWETGPIEVTGVGPTSSNLHLYCYLGPRSISPQGLGSFLASPLYVVNHYTASERIPFFVELTLDPDVISPQNQADQIPDTTTLHINTGANDIKWIEIYKPTFVSESTFSGQLVYEFPHTGHEGPQDVVWDGKDAQGNFLPDGEYVVYVYTEARETWKVLTIQNGAIQPSPTPTSTPTPTPSPSPTSSSTPIPSPTPTGGGGGGNPSPSPSPSSKCSDDDLLLIKQLTDQINLELSLYDLPLDIIKDGPPPPSVVRSIIKQEDDLRKLDYPIDTIKDDLSVTRQTAPTPSSELSKSTINKINSTLDQYFETRTTYVQAKSNLSSTVPDLRAKGLLLNQKANQFAPEVKVFNNLTQSSENTPRSMVDYFIEFNSFDQLISSLTIENEDTKTYDLVNAVGAFSEELDLLSDFTSDYSNNSFVNTDTSILPPEYQQVDSAFLAVVEKVQSHRKIIIDYLKRASDITSDIQKEAADIIYRSQQDEAEAITDIQKVMLTYFIAHRWFDPKTGRWIQQPPISGDFTIQAPCTFQNPDGVDPVPLNCDGDPLLYRKAHDEAMRMLPSTVDGLLKAAPEVLIKEYLRHFYDTAYGSGTYDAKLHDGTIQRQVEQAKFAVSFTNYPSSLAEIPLILIPGPQKRAGEEVIQAVKHLDDLDRLRHVYDMATYPIRKLAGSLDSASQEYRNALKILDDLNQKKAFLNEAIKNQVNALKTLCARCRGTVAWPKLKWKSFPNPEKGVEIGSAADTTSLVAHFKKHKREFGDNITQPEYYNMAKAFGNEKNARFLEAQVGSTLIKYDPATRRVFVGNTDRTIRTFYKADDRGTDPFFDAVRKAYYDRKMLP